MNVLRSLWRSPKILAYLRWEILKAVSFVMLAFVGLFAFFDVLGEIDRLNQPGASAKYYVLAVLLGLPSRVYEMAPVASLIGTIYALVQLAASSEFTAMRAAGLGSRRLLSHLAKVGLIIVTVSVFVGEVVAPASEKLAVPMRAKGLGMPLDKSFRSGYWLRDTTTTEEGNMVRLVNFDQFTTAGELQGLEYFELTEQGEVRRWVRAKWASYDAQQKLWTLHDLVVQRYYDEPVTNSAARQADIRATAKPFDSYTTQTWQSTITPQFLTGLFVSPERMSAMQLWNYSRFLKRNAQATADIDLALAKKLIYPVAIWVMMLIAASFAFVHFRSGGVSMKVFLGIMIGVGFHLINNLFSHLTFVAKLPPAFSAGLPTALGFVLGLVALWWVAQPAPWVSLRVWLKLSPRV